MSNNNDEQDDRLRTVGEVAQLLGVSVRTLHYWEQRGLIEPTYRTWSDYRLYSDTDIECLQHILTYRATGMSLEMIAQVLAGDSDRVTLLRHQRQLLMEKHQQLHQMVEAIDYLLEDTMSENKLSVDDIAAILGDAQFPVYQAEAEQQWGETSEWEMSQKHTAQMGKDEWQQLRSEMDELDSRLTDAMRAGVLPGSDEANRLAEGHRAQLSQFFPVRHSKHVVIVCGYVDDPRFRAHYDDRAEGPAVWLKSIIDANAAAHGVDPANAEWN